MGQADEPLRSNCPISFALEIFGDRWTLIVLRDLMLHQRQRYKDLLACEEGIATNVLADRLMRLEQRGLITKDRDPADARKYIYQPTELAVGLVPMLLEMIVWGARSSKSGRNSKLITSFKTEREALISDLQKSIREWAGLKEPRR
jgi:DNA-binding HxlR family transcriptional regulator